MTGFTTRELVHASGGNLIIGDPSERVLRISTDTRTLRKGDFFIALKGDTHDAHQYLRQAIDRGAAGLLVSDLSIGVDKNPWNLVRLPTIIAVDDTRAALHRIARYRRARSNAFIIGVTGTNGKTTVKEMLASIIAQESSVLSTRGNLNNHIGLPLMLLELEEDHQYAVLEMGASHAGDIAELAAIAQPKLGIVTNVTKAHLAEFRDIETIAATKWELVEALPEDGDAVLNYDDKILHTRIPSSHVRVTTFGLEHGADVRADNVSLWPSTQCTLVIGGKNFQVGLPVLGIFNIYNALAAAAAAWRIGIRVEHIIKGLEEFSPPPMRMQVIRLSNTNVIINDAYNANPHSMRESIKAFNTLYAIKRKVAVLGTMGELGTESAALHEGLGKFLATQALDVIYWIGEFGEEVRRGLAEQMVPEGKLKIFTDRQELADTLVHEFAHPCAMLFKASRMNRFETIIEVVREKYRP